MPATNPPAGAASPAGTTTNSAGPTLLASASRDGTGRVWELGSKRPGDRGAFRQHGDPFRALAFAPNGRVVAAGSGTPNGLIWLYDVSGKGPLESGVLRGARGAVDALAFSPDGQP